MRTISFSVPLTVKAGRNIAMCQAGLSPQLMAIKPGTRVERNRRSEQRRGVVKHKSRLLDA